MNKIFKSLSVMTFALAAVSASAQNTESTYFLDGSLYRHQMNPALACDSTQKSYISMSFIGNFNLTTRGSLGVKDVIFNRGGKTVTGLHPLVSADEFLGNVDDNNKFNQELKMQVFGFGKRTRHGFNVFEINIREQINLNLPGTILQLTKEGLQNKTYDISDAGAHADAFVELAFGRAQKINDKLTVGAKVKLLLGAGNMDLELNKAYLTAGADGKYTAEVQGELHGNVKGMEFKKKVGSNEFDKADVNDPSLSGWGLAVDLGATYKLNESWTFSASLLDLGFISWNTDNVAVATGKHTLDISDFGYVSSPHGFTNSKGEDLDDAFESFKDVYKLNVEGDRGSRTKMLSATLNFGAEYTAPFYEKLTFGLLNTTRIHGVYSWTDFRLSANVAPVKSFSTGLNFSAGTFGTGLGLALDYHPKGFGIFLAMDHMLGSMSKEGIPLNSNAEISMGINFPF